MVTSWISLTKPEIEIGFGSELISNGDFSSGSSGWTVGAGWSITIKATHIAGNSADLLSPSFSVVAGNLYRVLFTVSDYVAGDVFVNCEDGGQDVGADDDYLFDFTASNTGSVSVTFEPSIDFDGSLTFVGVKEFIDLTWTDLAKPSGTSYTDLSKPTDGHSTIFSGTPIGLLLALTYASDIVSGGNWTDIAKNTALWTNVNTNAASWTNIPKAT